MVDYFNRIWSTFVFKTGLTVTSTLIGLKVFFSIVKHSTATLTEFGVLNSKKGLTVTYTPYSSQSHVGQLLYQNVDPSIG